jgi:hypothetical protein
MHLVRTLQGEYSDSSGRLDALRKRPPGPLAPVQRVAVVLSTVGFSTIDLKSYSLAPQDLAR